MKLFFFISLSVLNTVVFSQSTSLRDQRGNLSVNDKGDLNKYVWSQTHTAKGKGDKPVLDYDALDNWEQVDNRKLSISPDGRYFSYGTYKGTNGNMKDDNLIVQSTRDGWKKTFPEANAGFFSADSKQYVFQLKDELVFLKV